MIAGIQGILKSIADNWIIIDVGGINFRLFAPTSTISSIGTPGNKIYVHTHLHVREDSLTLYGFASAEELKLFEMLINVSGIGPKVALSSLSALSPERLVLAISSANESLLSSIPGIGKKTAARIVLELKDKLQQAGTGIPALHDDIKAALVSLGYSAAEATSAIATIPNNPDLTAEDKIKLALQYFGRTG